MIDFLTSLPKTRNTARAEGQLYYFTGKPCKHGHVYHRLVANATCMRCVLDRTAVWKKQNWDKHLSQCQQWKHNHVQSTQQNSKEYYEKRGEHIRALSKKWRKQNPDRVCLSANNRRAQKLLATPKWVDEYKVAQIYLDACTKTKDTGILHEVDHIVPLRAKTVCGLHWEENLQVIPATTNRRKSNKVIQ